MRSSYPHNAIPVSYDQLIGLMRDQTYRGNCGASVQPLSLFADSMASFRIQRASAVETNPTMTVDPLAAMALREYWESEKKRLL